MHDKFLPNTLVWAKLSGYPYWPARILTHDLTTKLKQFDPLKKDFLGILFFGSELFFALIPTNRIFLFDKNSDNSKLINNNEEIRIAVDQAMISETIENPKFTPPTTIKIRNDCLNNTKIKIRISKLPKKLNKIMQKYPKITKNVKKLFKKIENMNVDEARRTGILEYLFLIRIIEFSCDPLNIKTWADKIISNLIAL